jgi:LPS-assembly lipoprotein
MTNFAYQWVRRLAVLGVLCIFGCGFQLRTPPQIAFATVYLSSAQPSAVLTELRRELTQPKSRVVSTLGAADAHVRIVREDREKVIFALSGAGRVREYQLRLKVTYSITDARDRSLVEPSEIVLNRLITYDDRALAAKEQEEQFLYRDMQAEATQQILRRLSLAKPLT